MVSALMADASGKIIDLNKKLIKLTDLQRKDLNQKLEQATAKAESSLALAKSKAGAVNVTSWVKAVGAVIGSFIFLVAGALVSGGIATTVLFFLFALSVLELVNTGIKSNATPAMVKSPDGTLKQLDLSIGGMVQQIVDQISHDHPDFYKSPEEKQQAVMGATMGITIFIAVVGFAASMGASGGANASLLASKIGPMIAKLAANNLLAGGRAVGVVADIAAGASTIAEGTYKNELAGINADTEDARADRSLLMTYLDTTRKDLDVFIDAYIQAYKLRDQSLEISSTNLAAASAVRSSIARNFC
jgi:hypothetical protein